MGARWSRPAEPCRGHLHKAGTGTKQHARVHLGWDHSKRAASLPMGGHVAQAPLGPRRRASAIEHAPFGTKGAGLPAQSRKSYQ